MIYDVKTRWDSAYKMLSRALYLRKAIDHFVDEDEALAQFKLTKKEWDQAAVIVTILLPFKMTSQRLQAIKWPAIDSVFWDYEALFNKIDAIKETLNKPEYLDDEDDPDDYRSFLNRQSREAAVTNEFDNYLLMPPPDRKTHTLDYWKVQSIEWPHLGLMVRDTFPVPATGAGVERIFSKSGRV